MSLRGRVYLLLVLVAALGVLLALVFAVGGGETDQAGGDRPDPGAGSPGGPEGLSGGEGQNVGISEEAEPPTALETIYNFDASDTRQLVGYSDAVFSGNTLRLVGEEPLKSTIPDDPGQPQQQWEVEVSEVLKGEGLRGLAPGARVVVNVAGGEDPETGEPVVIASAGETPPATDAPMEEGASYVFAVRNNERGGWLEVSAQPYGNVPVESREEYERVRADFERALANQVDPLADGVVSD